LVFFDATASTDSTVTGNMTAFQDVTYSWNFGDSGSSGTSTWAYGSNPNGNSRNVATGGVAAHLYVTQGSDTLYTAQVTATDQAGNTASCTTTITAYDPISSNGFPNTATTCYFNSTVGSGCPAGATQTTSSTTHVPSAGQQVLYKCGDSFTGNSNVGVVAKWSIGAYGACANTLITVVNQATFPQLSGTISIDTTASDGRVLDLVGNTGASAMVLINNAYDPPYTATQRITLNNLWSNATNTSFYVAQATEMGYIQLRMNNIGTQQGTFVNYAQNNCTTGSSVYPCATFVSSLYTAMLGGHYDGTGASGAGGVEPVRVSACRMCVFSDNDFLNANSVGSVFKFHSGNTKNTSCEWIGQYTENIIFSDNFAGGTSGAELVDMIAQNQVTDERLRNVIVERNIFAPSTSGHQLLFGVQNGTVRDNIFKASGASLGNRGFQGTSNNTSGSTCSGSGTTTAPILAAYPQYNEFYNNTCYNGGCGSLGGSGISSAANNSVAQNTLIYLSSTIGNSGSGNTVANNTVTTSNNPAFTNGSGGLNIISDFKPTVNFTGGVAVPVIFDALGTRWSPTWDWGAVHH